VIKLSVITASFGRRGAKRKREAQKLQTN